MRGLRGIRAHGAARDFSCKGRASRRGTPFRTAADLVLSSGINSVEADGRSTPSHATSMQAATSLTACLSDAGRTVSCSSCRSSSYAYRDADRSLPSTWCPVARNHGPASKRAVAVVTRLSGATTTTTTGSITFTADSATSQGCTVASEEPDLPRRNGVSPATVAMAMAGVSSYGVRPAAASPEAPRGATVAPATSVAWSTGASATAGPSITAVTAGPCTTASPTGTYRVKTSNAAVRTSAGATTARAAPSASGAAAGCTPTARSLGLAAACNARLFVELT